MKYMNICLSNDHGCLIHLSDTMEPLAVGKVKTVEDSLPLEEQYEIVTSWLEANRDSFPDSLKKLISGKLRYLREYLDERIAGQVNPNPFNKVNENASGTESTEPSETNLLERIEVLETQVITLQAELTNAIQHLNTPVSVGKAESAKNYRDPTDTSSDDFVTPMDKEKAEIRLINARAHAQELENTIVENNRIRGTKVNG